MRIACVPSIAALALALAGGCAFAQNTGYVKTKVDPGRAGVFIDGKYVGPAGNFGVGRKYTVAAGEHEVRLSEPRYEDVVAKVTVQAGKTTTVSQTLKLLPPPKPPFGRLRTITADKYAAVYINGKFMGHAGEFNNSMQGLQLNPGTYALKIVPVSGGAGHEEQIKIETDRTVIVRM